MFKLAEPQDAAASLIVQGNRLSFFGSPGALRFPPMCPRCGTATQAHLSYKKVFRRDDDEDEPTTYVVTALKVPFCASCIGQHEAQWRPMSSLQRLGSYFGNAEIFGAIFPGLGALFVGWLALGSLWHGRQLRFAVLALVALVFAMIARAQWQQVRLLTEPRRVAAQTDVTQAFDFSDDLSGPFESPRFDCTSHDERFSKALWALNLDQQWSPTSPKGQADRRNAKRKAWIVGAVVAVIALAGLISDWFM